MAYLASQVFGTEEDKKKFGKSSVFLKPALDCRRAFRCIIALLNCFILFNSPSCQGPRPPDAKEEAAVQRDGPAERVGAPQLRQHVVREPEPVRVYGVARLREPGLLLVGQPVCGQQQAVVGEDVCEKWPLEKKAKKE